MRITSYFIGRVLSNAQMSGFGDEAEISCSTRALPVLPKPDIGSQVSVGTVATLMVLPGGRKHHVLARLNRHGHVAVRSSPLMRVITAHGALLLRE